MKVTMHSSDGRFDIQLEPETIAEAAQLVRFSLNATKRLRLVDTTAYADGTFSSWISIGARKNQTGGVKP